MKVSARDVALVGGFLAVTVVAGLWVAVSRPDASDELAVSRAPRGAVEPSGAGLESEGAGTMVTESGLSEGLSDLPRGEASRASLAAGGTDAVPVETIRAVELHDRSDGADRADAEGASREALAAVSPSPPPDIAIIAVALSGNRPRVLVEKGEETLWANVPGQAFGYTITEATMRRVLVRRDGQDWELVLGEGRGRGSTVSGAGVLEGQDGGESERGSSGGGAAGSGVRNPHAHLSPREKQARKAEDVRAINDACWIYENDTGVEAKAVPQLMAEEGPPGYNGPYLRSANEPVDPYTGQPYVLKDGQVAGPGDVVSFTS